ncbi:hypothetical protein CEUSTIGMA_g3831.t1 [Chlamydomonas eustigma]|uniref:BTB domain-containing protein n=1 Tax=Chlamydomonas eustigma TaxID=1157962 RepID=A0A250X006_9CHLO|nr:hypothetical protein CEUSTIGMA_g3831.t1 [Chlamydomonas eustigma]|eukprot:GAX76385.1 hypothetical protein CEUSTIGMA_g3831.t1 [Chlamydomonas eustigma]
MYSSPDRVRDESVISLNVGGKSFTTYRATLLQYPDSMLYAMLSGSHASVSLNGELFIDRDPSLFEELLDFLRSGPDYELPTDARTCRRLLREFRYFQLPTNIFSAASPELARIYAVGGSTNTHMHSPAGTVMCYDTYFDGWCDIADLPAARACVASATLGNRLFILGGKDSWGKELSMVTTCELSTHTVCSDGVKHMATPRHTFSAVTAAGRLFAVGHGRLGDEAETVEFFDQGSAAWWSASPLPHSPKFHAVTAWPGLCGEPGSGPSSHGDHSNVMFSCGGQVGMPGVGLTCSKDLIMFDIRTRAWRSLASMPGPRSRHGMAACNGRLYIAGGCLAAGAAVESPTAAVLSYDVRAGRWLVEGETAPLPRPLDSLAAVAVGGRVYALGGLTGAVGGSPRRERVRSIPPVMSASSVSSPSTMAAGSLGRISSAPLSRHASVTAAAADVSFTLLAAADHQAAGSSSATMSSPGAGAGLSGHLSSLPRQHGGSGSPVEEERHATDVVYRLDMISNCWEAVRSMRYPMHSMSATAYHPCSS